MTLSVVSFASAPFFRTFLRLYFLVSIMRTHSLLFHMQTCTFSRVDTPFASSFAHPHPFRTRPFPTTLFSSCRNFHSALTNISPFALPDGSWSYPLPPWSQSSRDSVEHQRLRKQQQQEKNLARILAINIATNHKQSTSSLTNHNSCSSITRSPNTQQAPPHAAPITPTRQPTTAMDVESEHSDSSPDDAELAAARWISQHLGNRDSFSQTTFDELLSMVQYVHRQHPNNLRDLQSLLSGVESFRSHDAAMIWQALRDYELLDNAAE